MAFSTPQQESDFYKWLAENSNGVFSTSGVPDPALVMTYWNELIERNPMGPDASVDPIDLSFVPWKHFHPSISSNTYNSAAALYPEAFYAEKYPAGFTKLDRGMGNSDVGRDNNYSFFWATEVRPELFESLRLVSLNRLGNLAKLLAINTRKYIDDPRIYTTGNANIKNELYYQCKDANGNGNFQGSCRLV